MVFFIYSTVYCIECRAYVYRYILYGIVTTAYPFTYNKQNLYSQQKSKKASLIIQNLKKTIEF